MTARRSALALVFALAAAGTALTQAPPPPRAGSSRLDWANGYPVGNQVGKATVYGTYFVDAPNGWRIDYPNITYSMTKDAQGNPVSTGIAYQDLALSVATNNSGAIGWNSAGFVVAHDLVLPAGTYECWFSARFTNPMPQPKGTIVILKSPTKSVLIR